MITIAGATNLLYPVHLKNRLDELSLADYIQYITARQKEIEIVREMEFFQFEVEDAFGVKNLHEIAPQQIEDNPEAYDKLIDLMSDVIIERLLCLSDQLKALAFDSKSREYVDKLPETMLAHYATEISLDATEEIKASAMVHVPGCNTQQIKDMEEEIETLDPQDDLLKIKDYQKRLESLKKHEMVLWDVQNSFFAAYMRAAAIEQSIPQQDRASFMALEDRNLNPREYEKKRAEYLSNTMTVKERKELKDRDRLVRTFLSSAETNFIKRIPELVSLYLIPIGEPFSLHYAKKREEYIAKLDMNQLLGLINFIEAVLIASKTNTAESLETLLTTTQSKNLLHKGSTILESMVGSRLSGMF